MTRINTMYIYIFLGFIIYIVGILLNGHWIGLRGTSKPETSMIGTKNYQFPVAFPLNQSIDIYTYIYKGFLK